MKILRFVAQNVKGIKVAEISPDGDVVTISGKNGAGKSSVLDAIQATLCGGKLPLKAGESKGKVEIDLGEYTVTRNITEATDRLVIKNKEGMSAPSPRTFLQKFVGPLSIDPLGFIRLKSRDQLDVLFEMLPGLKDGLELADKSIAEVKQKRSNTLAIGNRLKVQLEGMPEHDAPAEPVNVAELTEEYQRAVNANAERAQLRLRIEENREALKKMQESYREYRKKIQELTDIAEDLEHDIVMQEQKLNEVKDVPPDIELGPITAQILSVEETNRAVAENAKRAEVIAAIDKERTTYSELGFDLKKAEAAKAKLLTDAKMPIEGLSVEGGEVTYKGIQVSQLSTAERVRVGAAIAVAQTPQAKIVLADDVSLLDSESLKVLHETCSGYQLWQVVNDESGDVGFFIEEGTVSSKK